MPEETPEPSSERTSIMLRPSEQAALKWLIDTNPKYDGMVAVLRDYSLDDLVAFHRRATQPAAAVA